MAAEIEGNGELLMSILICLPIKSVFRFKLVSKRWNGISDHPIFLRIYSNSNSNTKPTLFGFVHERNILPATQTTNHKIKQIPKKCGEYVNSSNGLILCNSYPLYHVLNPVTGARISFPGPDLDLSQLGLSCIENTRALVPSFKVVGVFIDGDERDDKKSLLIGTYSSETRKWTKSTLTALEEFALYFITPFVSNDVFHWRAQGGFLAVYDSNGDENYVQLIKELPSAGRRFDLTITRSSVDEVIWVGRKGLMFDWLLWMLPKDENGSYRRSTIIPEEEWILVWKINQDSFLLNSLGSYFSLEAMIPGNPVLVIFSVDGRPFLYDPASKSIEFISDQGPSLSGLQRWIDPYMEPHSLSSYALSSYNRRR